MYKLFLETRYEYEVFAPIKRDIIRFESLKEDSKIDFSENSYFPIKEHFFRKEEIIFQFDGTRLIPVKLNSKKKLFFGVRRCDLNGIRHQDMVFIEQHQDPYYKFLRDRSLLIGYHCNKAPSKYCFCESLDLNDFYDIMFFDRGDYFLVDVKTQKGRDFLKRYKKYFEITKYKINDKDRYIRTRKLNKKDISHLYDHKGWKIGIDLCLSCGACTEMCPTCYCHEIHDKVNIHDSKKGERLRSWSSCQLKEFTSVAEGHTFRDSKEARFKHRIYHQIQYFREKNGVTLCTGCGRCISGCPTGIDWVKIINAMK